MFVYKKLIFPCFFPFSFSGELHNLNGAYFSYGVPKKTKKEKKTFYIFLYFFIYIHKHNNLPKIQNKSVMRAPVRAKTFNYVKV